MSITLNGTTGINTKNIEVNGQGYNPPISLSDAATINWDWSSAQSATVTISANRTLNTPTNAVDGQYSALRVDRSSAAALSFSSAFKGIGNISQSTTIGYVDHFVFRYNGTDFELVSFKANIGA